MKVYRNVIYVLVIILFLGGFFLSSETHKRSEKDDIVEDHRISALMLYHHAAIYKIKTAIDQPARKADLHDLLSNQVSPHLIEKLDHTYSIESERLKKEMNILNSFGKKEEPTIAFESNQVITLQTKADLMHSVTYKRDGQHWVLYSYSVEN